MSALSSAAGESPDAPLLVMPMSQMCHSLMGTVQGEFSHGGELGSLSFPPNDCFLSLYPSHQIGKPGVGELAGKQIKLPCSKTSHMALGLEGYLCLFL